MKSKLVHIVPATVAVYRHPRDGIDLCRPVMEWLKKSCKGEWGVHYFGESETERDATFLFERASDARAFTQVAPTFHPDAA